MKPAGSLHGSSIVQRRVGGFLVTEGTYAPSQAIGRHEHELASVCVVLAGGYEEGFGQRRRRADPGVVIVHPEGETHEEAHDPIRAKLLTIEVDASLLRDLRPAIRAFDDAWHRTDYTTAAWAYRICFEIARADNASALMAESSILDMLGDLDRIRLPEAGKSAWLSRVRDYLEAEFQYAPAMSELSDLAGVHPVYLARAFRRRFGCSIGEYVRRLQVGRAALLLEDEACSLSMVAAEAGFADQSHMTRRMGEQTGLTPGAWRRRMNGQITPACS